MNTTIELIKAIVSEGLDNQMMQTATDTRSSTFFGTKEDVALDGTYLGIWCKKDNSYKSLDQIPTTYVMELEDDDEYRLRLHYLGKTN